MSEKLKLYKYIENFIDNNCEYKKNESFITNFCGNNVDSNLLPKIHDNNNFIKCIMNLPKEKESLIKEIYTSKEIKVNIIDSSFEFVLYKNNNNPSVIKWLLLLVINDLEKVEQKKEGEQDKNDVHLSDINSEYKLLENLKKFIFNYIKKNKKNKNNPNNTNDSNNNELENILLGGAKNEIRFFNHDKNGINYEDENIKKIIEIIKSISSKLEIKQKKNENEKKNKTTEGNEDNKEVNKKNKNDKGINEVLNELNPDFKNELIYRYLDEMPEEIVKLMKKYRNINFTKNMYLEYINTMKNGGIGNEDKKEEN